jgi:acyl dehydratase
MTIPHERAFHVGDLLAFERRFTDEDVVDFQRISGDAGRHHAQPDARGRRMVHGLLTATLPTKLGGDIDFIAREMHFDFLRPVFAGDTIRCEMSVDEVAKETGRVRLTLSGACWNQDGKEVLHIVTRGVVLDEGV